jgi:hypothetical protein
MFRTAKRWMAGGSGRQVGVVIALSAAISGCCDTKANLGVQRGKTISPRELPGSVVVVCPGEEVTFGWMVNEAQSASLTDAGDVPIPTGSKTMTVSETKDYKLTAKGKDCDASATANVVVATAGTHFVFSTQAKGTPRDGTLRWEAVLPEAFYSPNVRITSIRLNAPPTVGGWNVRKVDLNGTVRQFPVTNVFATPWTTSQQLAGTWSLVPINPAELDPSNLPTVVELEVTLTCDQ